MACLTLRFRGDTYAVQIDGDPADGAAVGTAAADVIEAAMPDDDDEPYTTGRWIIIDHDDPGAARLYTGPDWQRSPRDARIAGPFPLR